MRRRSAEVNLGVPELIGGADRARRRRRPDPARGGARPAAPPPRRHPGKRAGRLRGARALRPRRRALAGGAGRRADAGHPRLRRRPWCRRRHAPAGAAEPPFALVATGGYGRGVLAPFSDIDLLFLTDAAPGPRAQRLVEFILYLLWDLGLKVGHATRTIRECMAEAGARRDACSPRSWTRASWSGERAVFERFRAAFDRARQERGFGPFLAAKRAERAARHARYGDSPYHGGAAREGGPRRPARPADALLARPLRLRRGADAGAGGAGQPGRRPAHRAGGARHPPRLELPLDRALPPPLRRRPRRGAADLRPAAGGRRPHGLRAARPAGRRRALHEAPVPDGARRDPADPRAGAGDRARGARPARRAAAGRRGAGRGGPGARRRQAGGGAARPRLRARAGADAPHPARGARPQAGDPSAGAPRADPQRAPRRPAARRPGGERALPRPADRPRRRAVAADDERDRVPVPLHPRLVRGSSG